MNIGQTIIRSDRFALSKEQVNVVRFFNQIFPYKQTGPLWMLYSQLLEKSIRLRFGKNSTNQLTQLQRILLSEELVNLRQTELKTIKDEEKEGIFPLLDSLIMLLMDLLMDPKKIIISAPHLKLDVSKFVFPSNVTGASCFCDVTLVSMFIAQEAYDFLLYPSRSPFITDTPLWENPWTKNNKAVSILTWSGLLISPFWESPCYLKSRKNFPSLEESMIESLAKSNIEDIHQNLREKIVNPMRGLEEKSSVEIGIEITKFLKELAEKCGVLTLGKRGQIIQEDAALFFSSLFTMQGWESMAFSTTRNLVIEEYTSIIPEGISPPPPKLISSIESFFDMAILFLPGSTTDIIDLVTLLKRKFLGSFTQDEVKGKFNVKKTTHIQLVRIPNPFVFFLQRGVQGLLVKLPQDEKINVPIMGGIHTIPCRIRSVGVPIEDNSL